MLNKDGLYHIFVEESRELLTALEADLIKTKQEANNHRSEAERLKGLLTAVKEEQLRLERE